MAQEIEKKFLVEFSKLEQLPKGKLIQQGYFETSAKAVVRARVKGEQGFLTVKGPTEGASRLEFEYEIPLADAKQMIAELCARPVISKTRYEIEVADHVWELDIFEGENAGLVIAEIELSAEDEVFVKPDWVSVEVTDDARYYNSNLIKHPYTTWS